MTDFLDGLHLPNDLLTLDVKSLEKVADEVRQRIILTTLKNGGHLASNLGVVELTTALLSVFDPKDDRIFFDIGHQCYAYKILTDRRDRFDGLRQMKGISGFPDPMESPFDKLVAGHAGTALPEACGWAAHDLMIGKKKNNVSIIGDGSFTNGHTLEALNNAFLYPKQIVLINENGFSISPAEGAFTRRLSKLDPTFREEVDENTFADLGFAYIGKVDGHDISQLQKAFRLAKKYDGNVIVAIKTVKGKGYALAEEDPVSRHTVGGGESFSTYTGSALVKLAQKDDRVCVITAGMKDGNGLAEFAQKFPARFFDAGIAEGFALSFACGLARSGARPYVVIYGTFFTRALDQMLFETKGLPITFIANRGGIVNNDGDTHQGIYTYPTMSLIPDCEICLPSGVEEYQKVMDWSLSLSSPLAIILPKQYYSCPTDFESPSCNYLAKFDESKDVLVALGATAVKQATMASDILGFSDIKVDVLNARFPKTVSEIDFKGKNVYVIEESPFSFTAYLSRFVKVKGSFGIQKSISHGTLEEILFEQGMSVGAIVARIKQDHET